MAGPYLFPLKKIIDNTMLNILIRAAEKTYPQKPVILRPLTKNATTQSNPALIRILNNPNVKILIGREKILTMGFMARFTNPRSIPAVIAVLIP
jgi:hypothetical protein